jgi:hypothetical protein
MTRAGRLSCANSGTHAPQQAASLFDDLVGDGEHDWRRNFDAESGMRLLLARIVGWIDVIDTPRTDELNLENTLLISGPSEVRVLCRIYPQGARL